MKQIISSDEAFMAMFIFLERYYEMTQCDGIGGLLGGLQILADGKPADAAMRGEFEAAVEEAKRRLRQEI
jgi:hypothetical protein